MSAPYCIAAEALVDETIVSRSRFICYLRPANSIAQAKDIIKTIQAIHPQASHHCYAFIAGIPQDSQRYGFSDDGEPTGTAGKPMLLALQGGNVGEVCAVVVRYFGGTKLGTGGLQRAYGGSVRQALSLLATKIKIPMVHKTLACQYTQVKDVIYLIKKAGGEVVSQTFAEQVMLTFAIPEAEKEMIDQQISTFSSGQLCFKNVD